MAENYLQSLLRPFSQRRQRGASMLDSMDSQATMDRLQGSNVTNASMPSQGGGGGILQMASAATGGGGGDGGGVIRTASRATGGRSPFRTAQQTEDDGNTSSAQCKPGMQCYRGPSTVVGSEYPMQTTVSQPQIISERVISSRPVVTSSQPTTTYSDPVTSTALPDVPGYSSFMGQGRVPDMVNSAIQNSQSYQTAPMAVAQMRGAGLIMADESLQQGYATSNALLPKKIEALDATIDLMKQEGEQFAATAAATRSEGKMTDAMTAKVAADTIPGITEQERNLVDDVMYGSTSVESGVNAVLEQRSRVAETGVDKDGKRTIKDGPAPPSGGPLDEQKTVLRRQFQQAQAIGFVYQVAGAMDATNGEEAIDFSELARRTKEKFIDNLDESGYFAKPARELRQVMFDDVGRVMIRAEQRRHTMNIDPNKNPEDYAKRESEGADSGMKMYDVLLAEVMEEHKLRSQPAAAPEPQGGVSQSPPAQDARPQAAPPGGYQMYGGAR